MRSLKKILIIEDDPDITELLRNRLKFHDYEVITATDGEDGFLKFLKEHPDLIILDLMLPKISGHEICRKIRREKEDKIPILMLTAKNEDADKIVGRVEGADKYMTKPFSADELLNEVKFLLTRGDTHKKILVADDESDIVEIIKNRLEVNHYEVITASDGEEALHKAKTEKPNLIVLDVMMPKMDGYKVCGLLKRDLRYSKIPIIMLTARAQQEDMALGEELGADAYIAKPFNSEVLLGKIKELMKL